MLLASHHEAVVRPLHSPDLDVPQDPLRYGQRAWGMTSTAQTSGGLAASASAFGTQPPREDAQARMQNHDLTRTERCQPFQHLRPLTATEAPILSHRRIHRVV